ncbi:MAG TPA: BACON domain-containing carbohydrate-binding protein [Acidobacteriota bacterium]
MKNSRTLLSTSAVHSGAESYFGSTPFGVVVCLAIILILSSFSALMASTVTLLTPEDLVSSADAIVRGRVAAIQSSLDESGAISTYISVSVQRDYLSGVAAESTIHLKELGGRLHGKSGWVFGSPQFEVDEEVLLFVKLLPNGYFRTVHFFQGKFSVRENGDLDSPVPADVSILGGASTRFTRLRQIEEATRGAQPRELGDYVPELKLQESEAIRTFSLGGLIEEESRQLKDGTSGSRQFNLTGGGIRWNEFDGGKDVAMQVNPKSSPVDAALTMAIVNRGLQAWNTVDKTRIRLVNGGETTLQGFSNIDNVNVISFGDPQGIIQDLVNCRGALAVTYTGWDGTPNRTINGTNFRPLQHTDIIFNNGVECSLAEEKSLEEVMGHELGHAIGLSHSSENLQETDPVLKDALMFFALRGDGRGASVRTDDIRAVQFVYPDGCTFLLSAASASHGRSAESGSVNVTAESGCLWSAQSYDNWISITSGAKGNGIGQVNYSVAANRTNSPRTGRLSVAGQFFSITQATCGYELSPKNRDHGAGAETGSVDVTAASGCGWSANSTASWITITSTATGSGGGSVTYSLTPNKSNTPRTGSIIIAEQTFSVKQESLCPITLDPANFTHGAGAENGKFSVKVPEGCKWTAASDVSWITITAGSTGSGDGTVEYSIRPNDGTAPRNGSIFIGDKTFSVKQDPRCPFKLNPSNKNHDAGEEFGSFAVSVPGGCSWAAAANVSWITVVSGNTGSGDGTIAYQIAPNSGSTPRTGQIIVDGQSFSITQATRCPYKLTPSSVTHEAGPQTATVSVLVPGGCPWTAKPSASWIKITAGGSGSGNGIVTYSLTANFTPLTRTGTITIGDQALNISQKTDCLYTLNPTYKVHSPARQSSTIQVKTNLGPCTWTAVSNDGWITVVSGKSGTGNGIVGYFVDQNTSPEFRHGTITIGPEKYHVYQDGVGCPYTWSPGFRDHNPSAGSGNFTISMVGICPYTASSSASWLTITSKLPLKGSSIISYIITANTTPKIREGLITFAARSEFPVTQATPCPEFAIDPGSRAHGPGNETGSVTVANAKGCNWTAAASVKWITIAAGKTGSNDGVVKYTLAPNKEPAPRESSIVIGGDKTFTLRQETSCPLTIAPSGRSHEGGAETGNILVTIPDGCVWNATASAGWITITEGKTGSGDGVVKYSISPNTTALARIGQINLLGKLFNITQAPNCPFALIPTTRAHGPSVESGIVYVSGGSTCKWTAASNVPWIKITSDKTGTGDGSITYQITANTAKAARSGTLTIGGQTFTVNQSSGGPDLSIGVTHASAFVSGGQGTYVLTVQNVGPTNMAGSTTVTDTLPPGLTFVSADGNGWSCSASGQTVTCSSSASVATGLASTIKLVVGIGLGPGTTVVNTAQLANATDTNFYNDIASDTATVVAGGAEAEEGSNKVSGFASLITNGGSDTPVIGYARIQGVPGQGTPSGLALFNFRQNGVIVTEASVPASPMISSGRIYAQVDEKVNTGLAIANPGDEDALISFHFTDEDGKDFGAGSFVVTAHSQIAAFLDQPPFGAGALVNATMTFRASIPVGAVALRGHLNERSEFLLTTLPVADMGSLSSETLILPHFAEGGGWNTDLVLVNPTDQSLRGSVQFFDQGSTDTPAQAQTLEANGENKNSFEYSIPARGAYRLATAGKAIETRAGSIRVTPAAGDSTPVGLGLFSFRSNGVLVTEAGVPALRPASAFRLYAETSGAGGPVQTGFAIANPLSTPVDVNVELLTLAGTPTGVQGSLSIPANGQVATYLVQVPGFEFLQGPFQGLLRVSAEPGRISAIGLRARVNERDDFLITTTSPVSEDLPAWMAPLILPHFADGGGYTTQFVLYSGSPSQSYSGIIEFFTQSGRSLRLPLR